MYSRSLWCGVWLSLTVLTVACGDRGSRHGDLGAGPDAGRGEPGDGGAPIPGDRPALESAGQLVPLLYARSVLVQDRREGQALTQRIPLDDPTYPASQAFFTELERACRSRVEGELSLDQPAWDPEVPCGELAAVQLHVMLCRAGAAVAFAGGQRGSVVQGEQSLELELGSAERPGVRFAVVSAGAHERASWAMLGAATYQEVIGRAGRLFEPAACSADTESLPARALASRALATAAQALQTTTTLADQLLAARLVEKYADADDEPESRAAGTRGLSESVLERLKLFHGVPYAAFAPVEGEALVGEDPPDRYPTLYAGSARTQQLGVVLAALRVPLSDAHAAALSEEALLEGFFANLRAAHPLVFGWLGAGEVDVALAQLGVEREELSQAARWLRGVLRVSGLPRVTRTLADGEHTSFESLAHLSELGPQGYAQALTEARATLQTQLGAEYTSRGLSSALEYARRIAQRGLAQGLDDQARQALSALDEALPRMRGRAELCLRPTDEERVLRARLRVLDLSEDRAGGGEAPRFELFAGESGISCALSGQLLQRACAAHMQGTAGLYLQAERALEFALEGSDTAPTMYLTERGLDPQNVEGRRVVAVVSLRALDWPSTERCGVVPLDSESSLQSQRVHTGQLTDRIPRQPERPRGRLALELDANAPVPPGWGHQLTLRRQQGALTVDPSQPFDSAYQALQAELLDTCEGATRAKGQAGKLCADEALRELDALRCTAQVLTAAEATLAGYEISPRNDEQALALAFWAYQAQQSLALELATQLKQVGCEESTSPADEHTKTIDQVLWELAAPLAKQLETTFRALLESQQQRIAARWQREPAAASQWGGITRDLSNSRLAVARLLVGVPRGAYADESAEDDMLGGVFSRFPVTTRASMSAEDALAESLLRRSGLHPLLPELSVVQGQFSPMTFGTLLTGNALAERLRTRLMALDPVLYGSLPAPPGGFLDALGLTRAELASAAVRLVQLSEARGSSLLALPNTVPVQVPGLQAGYAAPRSAHLYGLTEGRLQPAPEAWPTSFGARGIYHTLALLTQALAANLAQAPGVAPEERARRAELHAQLASKARAPEVALELSPSARGLPDLTLEIHRSPGSSVVDPRELYELWWTDAGERCAATGRLDGVPCHEADFRFSSQRASLEILPSDPDGSQRIRLSGFAWPTPTGWDPGASTESGRTRVYLSRREGDTRKVLGAVEVRAGATREARFELPESEALAGHLRDLLAYREPGEGCESCRPSSVCEQTSCEFGLCSRTPLDGNACASAGICRTGVCDMPGCGDGARSSGDSEVPFEACDDGNLESGDGCSALCSVEVRTLEPLSEEGWPAGPAPAIAVDGLGRGLLVYMADDLVGESVRLRAARFDAFGHQAGSEFDLATGIPRGFRVSPTVAGLTQGGFAVVFASADLPGGSGVVFRLVDVPGATDAPHAIEANGSAQSEARVVAVDDGFVVAWVEQGGASTVSRVYLKRFGPDALPHDDAVSVGEPTAGVAQREPVLASSLGQILVAWSELESTGGGQRGVRAQRFGASLAAVDGQALELASGASSEPSASVDDAGDYLVAWSTRNTDERGDLALRSVRRFGAAPLGGMRSLVATAAVEARPVLAAGSAEDGYLVAYQQGAPFPTGALQAAGIDDESLELARAELALSDTRDVSVVRTPQGIWLVWSRRMNARRALYALLLPP
jgi:cysteine-rich repeat protein